MNPFCSRILQTSKPARTRSLPNRDLDLSYEDLAVEAARNLGWGGGFEKERKRFNEVRTCLFDRIALACDVEFRAECYKPVVFTLDDRRHLSQVRHGKIVRQVGIVGDGRELHQCKEIGFELRAGQ